MTRTRRRLPQSHCLQANVMLEYTYEEAEKLLTDNLSVAEAKLVRALHAAIPLLAPHVEVVLLAPDAPDGAPPHAGFDPFRHLEERGVAVSRRAVAGDRRALARATLDASTQGAIDLLVCGASGKRRLDDCRLDETARCILAGSTVPVLMAH